MKRVASIVLVAILMVFGLIAVPARAQDSGFWTAEYYNNAALVGLPTLTRTEDSPTNNWQFGAPVNTIRPDFFSARFSRFQRLNGGQYRLDVRVDDGVRVFVDGDLVIDEWHPSPAERYSVTLNLATGDHNFIIHYFEATEIAFLEYNLTPLSTTASPGSTSPTGASASVTVGALNLRDAPNVVAGNILTQIRLGETYPIIGRNPDNTWVQLDVNGLRGWSNSGFLTTVNLQNVPITHGGAGPLSSSAIVTAFFLNVRSAPDPFSDNVLTRITRDESYPVLGRNADSSWVQINVSGTVGWVNSNYVSVSNFENVPVVSNALRPTGVSAAVTAGILNVRDAPDAFVGFVVTRVRQGEVYDVVGRNANASWVQLNAAGTIGWANSSFLNFAGDVGLVPVTG